MITNVREERLLVTSDTHIGSLFCDARRGIVRFLEYACDHGYNVCINGDGIETQYTSLDRFARETSSFFRDLTRLSTKLTIYYTIGNHDILLEHYLGSWGGVRLVPFLNVRSGPLRIRIEHGHLYDPVLKDPDLHPGFTQLMTLLFRACPPAYHWHAKYELLKYRHLRRLLRLHRDVPDSALARDVSRAFLAGAEAVSRRGFDVVIFGHTHQAGELPIDAGRARYLNTGSWFGQPHYVRIDRGRVDLAPWPPERG